MPVRVAVFTLGGTIAMAPRPASGAAGNPGAVPALTGRQLLNAVPGLDGIDAEVHEFRQLPSASLTIADVCELAAAIGDVPPPRCIQHHTIRDPSSPPAHPPNFVPGRCAPRPRPGRPPNSSRFLAQLGPAYLGALVVFGDEIHAARFVRKADTTSVTAFTSPRPDRSAASRASRC